MTAKRKPAPKPERLPPAVETLTQEQRERHCRSEWSIAGRDYVVYIVHRHDAHAREMLQRGAWYEVTDGGAAEYVRDRDFAAALAVAHRMLRKEGKL